MKIIIIEDEGITRQWLKKKLEELSEDNHVEGVFSNGRKALDYLECEKDVMLSLRIYACLLWMD